MSDIGSSSVTRRHALSMIGSVAAAATTTGTLTAAETASAAGVARGNRRGLEIYKSVKWGMIQAGDSLAAKFRLCQELGYDGMELTSPFPASAEEVRTVADQTGMPVHGLVPSWHWAARLSDPRPETRRAAQQKLLQAIRDCHGFGGSSVLLVPGKVAGSDETHDDVWRRSIAGIREVLPVAAKLGVRILIENVWNGFCETPQQFRDYIDEINSPWVGVYFDLGNCQKFAPTAEWIDVLGTRIVKLDVKDWSQQDGFGKITEGDVDWPAVQRALQDIRFTGWSTAEVAGGDRDRLAEIAHNMNGALCM